MERARRLTNHASFNYIYKHGTAISSPLLVLIYVRAAGLKIGISVSKKVGGSVTRNKTKRRIREAATSLIPHLCGNFNYVIAAREGIANADFHAIKDSLAALFKKAGHLTS
ncbi:MAG: ribonuclease P protein component [Clostridia bacterium]|nr:ribonuclease P protein component [Clostridia bacterium]